MPAIPIPSIPDPGRPPMQISKLFAKDINRPINGVIKVAQDDAAPSSRSSPSTWSLTSCSATSPISSKRTTAPSTFPPTKWACGSPASSAAASPTS
ncbi:MAG: hypothetical protein ACLTDR_11280 [Adlercreutzia equolifaciens]